MKSSEEDTRARVAREIAEAANLLRSLAADIAADVDERIVMLPIEITVSVGGAGEAPTLTVRKEYYAMRRETFEARRAARRAGGRG